MRVAYMQFGRLWFDIEEFKLDTAMAEATSRNSRWGANPGLYRSMDEGIPITPPFIDLKDAVITRTEQVNNGGYYTKIITANPNIKVVNHEGRNRARIAWEKGIRLIPTRFFISPLKNWFGGYEVHEAIWDRPDIEAAILRNLGIMTFKLDRVG